MCLSREVATSSNDSCWQLLIVYLTYLSSLSRVDTTTIAPFQLTYNFHSSLPFLSSHNFKPSVQPNTR